MLFWFVDLYLNYSYDYAGCSANLFFIIIITRATLSLSPFYSTRTTFCCVCKQFFICSLFLLNSFLLCIPVLSASGHFWVIKTNNLWYMRNNVSLQTKNIKMINSLLSWNETNIHILLSIGWNLTNNHYFGLRK